MRSSCSVFTVLFSSTIFLAAIGCSSGEDASSSSGSTTSVAASSTGAGDGGAGGAGQGGAGQGGAGGQGGEGTAGPIGGDRPVEVFVPSSYKEGTPAPLVILLHGYTSSGAGQEAYFKMQPLAESKGFLYAHPDGTKETGGNQFWNATDACCDLANSGVDDSAYLRKVIDDIKAKYTVDPKRVYFVGHSNGGFMSFRMACDHADAVAAIASLAGAMVDDISKCKPSEPVAVLQIHGTADDTVNYNGGSIGPAAYPGAQGSVEDWATLDGCDLKSETLAKKLDLESSLAGEETEIQQYASGCKPGGHAELWTIQEGSHVPNLSDNFAPAVIDFLLAHPKP